MSLDGDLLSLINRASNLEHVAFYAERVMNELKMYKGNIIPHLLDTDENDGERLREALRRLKES